MGRMVAIFVNESGEAMERTNPSYDAPWFSCHSIKASCIISIQAGI